MDDRKPGTKAPEPNAMASGWSLAHALDGATRRTKPKASLSRHLVGYRVARTVDEETSGAAVPHPGVPFDAAAAQTSSEDGALVARAAQAGEASWAHERIALIGRALDEEAKRLAADPEKAGKVAEHLAPLIEQAFAGADAEAPGDYARAIVGRERELLETELLAERAVMSVAATQRAEYTAQQTILADELALLKAQPQRWAATHARRGRSIDDLPLDETRKRALKGATARAQANAAAEGLLQQDASWLLEDLDDPEFASALGADDAARWRSEAETAIGQRADRIAAESAERALLAAADMRATLKRLKDKDDGPLPSQAEVAAALGGDDAARVALAAALKGRKRRYAETSVALMAPADEARWIAAAPDKETRTVREQVVATKRAAVAGNPGRWLMKNSATLKELAKDATDDPAHLPRLIEQYATLRNQVRGRAANDDGTGAIGEDATRTSIDANAEAPLPDEMAAALAEQVLAGETPQARIDALTKTLDGAAGAGSNEDYGAGADADGHTQATSIARQLEALALPEGTAATWAQLSNPYTRRAARIALLGAFAKQIREEEAVLTGEGEDLAIVGEDGEDTLSEDAIGKISEAVESIPQFAFRAPIPLTARQALIRRELDLLVKNGDISRAEADRFLADERLQSFVETELPQDVAAALASGEKSELVDALSIASDYILLGAEKLAELEEEYGWWIRGALFVGRTVIFGPISAFLSGAADVGIEKFLEEYGQEAIEFLIDGAGHLVKGVLPDADDATAQKIAVAGIIAGSLLLGVGSIPKIVRHVAGRFRRSSPNVETTFSNVSQSNDPSNDNLRPHDVSTSDGIQALDEYLDSLSFRKLPSNKSVMNDFLLDPELLDVPLAEKAAIKDHFAYVLLPRAVEIEFATRLGPLVDKAGLQLLSQYRLPIGDSGRHSVPDFMIVRRDPGPVDFDKDVPALLEFIQKDLKAIFEAKSGAGELTGPQRALRRWILSITHGADVRAINMPIGAVSEDSLIRAMSETLHRAHNRIDVANITRVLRVVVKNSNPGLPVWVVMLSGAIALGMLGEESET